MTDKKALEIYQHSPDYPVDVLMEADEIAYAALKEKIDGGWISVEDKLPSGYIEGELGTSEPEEYIIQIGDCKYATVAMFDTVAQKFVPSIYSDTYGFYDDVTNWMYMPKPPQKGANT